MKAQRKVSLLLIALLLLTALMGCGNKEEKATMDIGLEKSAPLATAENGSERTPGDLALTVGKTAAWAFEGVLYGAAEVKNTGSVNVLLKEAQFSFDYDGGQRAETFVPVMSEYDVLSPGETGFCTLFLPVEGITAGTAVALHATVTPDRAASDPAPLIATSPRLIQNYPGFATLSGELKNAAGAKATWALNMVQAGFYDEEGAFLGAWYFSKNAVLAPGVSKPFVVHLQALPIPELAARTKNIALRAFGV